MKALGKFQGKEIWYKEEKGNRGKMLLFCQWDLGAKFRVMTKSEEYLTYNIPVAFETISEAKRYYDKIVL